MLGKRFEEALTYSCQVHRFQKRKGTNIPYIAHLLSVSALVLENGGDEAQAIAALLHDAVEDQGGSKRLEEIKRLFGDQVAAIVEQCTDSFVTPKPDWRRRKQIYLNHLISSPLMTQRVSLADKVHNARSILSNLRTEGENVWKRFTGGKDGTLWYYRELAGFAWHNDLQNLASELVKTVEEIDLLSCSKEEK